MHLRQKAAQLYQRARLRAALVPVKVRIVVGLVLVAGVLLAMYTALTANDSSLHLKLQHDFHSAQASLWVDDELAYSGKITGSARKRFGLIPSDSAQGNLSQIIPMRSGRHNIRLRIDPEDAAMQEDSVSGDFSPDTERDLSVSARHSGLSVSWQGTGRSLVETSSTFNWFSRYAGSLFLTIVGSIMSALAGYAIKELPARFRSTSDSGPEAELGPQ